MEKSNQNLLTKSTSGTYKFNNSTISTYNGHVKLNQYSKLDKKPRISEEDHKYLYVSYMLIKKLMYIILKIKN